MRIKATIVAYAFSVQYFENATIVAYASLRVKTVALLVPEVGRSCKRTLSGYLIYIAYVFITFCSRMLLQE